MDVLADVGKAVAGPPPPTAALLSKDGSLVFVGQPRGLLTVVDARSLRILDIVKVPGDWTWFVARASMSA